MLVLIFFIQWHVLNKFCLHNMDNSVMIYKLGWSDRTILNAKVGIFSQSYVVILSFISCFGTFYCLDPYFNFTISFIFYICDCSIRVTAVLEYTKPYATKVWLTMHVWVNWDAWSFITHCSSNILLFLPVYCSYSLDGRLMAKISITTIQMNLVPNPSGEGNTNSPELSLLKFLPLAYHQVISWLPPWISNFFSQ